MGFVPSIGFVGLGKEIIDVFFYAFSIHGSQHGFDCFSFRQFIKLLVPMNACKLKNQSKAKLWVAEDKCLHFRCLP